MERICKHFGKSKAWYYAYTKSREQQEKKLSHLLSVVRTLRREHAEYGVFKMHYEMWNTYKLPISRATLYKLMKKYDLMSLAVRRKRNYARSRVSAQYPNLLAQTQVTAVNQVWATDITYIHCGSGYKYLALVIDYFSRKIIGCDLSDSLKTDGVTRALRMALQTVPHAQGIIHHSDRGTQYTSQAYQNLLLDEEMIISQTGAGKCYDNAVMERVNNTLKTELHCGWVPVKDAAAHLKISRAIQYYNRERIHASLGYLTPQKVYDLCINRVMNQNEQATSVIARASSASDALHH